MKKNRFKKPTEREIRERAHATAAEYASITGVKTRATRTPDGLIRFHHADWPMQGEPLAESEGVDKAA